MRVLSIRVIEVGKYLVENKCTVRETSKHFGISKSTVHIDITKRLKFIDKDLYNKARAVLDTNIKERHIRGGEATKLMYEQKRAEKIAKEDKKKDNKKNGKKGKTKKKSKKSKKK